MAQAAKTERLRSLFTQAFEASPRFKVLNDSDQSKAELVLDFGLKLPNAHQALCLSTSAIRMANSFGGISRTVWNRGPTKHSLLMLAASSFLEEMMSFSR